MRLIRRIWGLIIILRAFLPLVVVVALYLIGRQLVVDVQKATAPHVARIESSVANICTTLDDTRQTVDRLDDQIDSMATSAKGIQEAMEVDLGSVTQATGVKPFQLADKLLSLVGIEIAPVLETTQRRLSQSVGVLGLSQVKGVFGDLTTILEDLAKVAGVTRVTEDVEVIVTEGKAAWRRGVRVVTETATRMIVLALVVLELIAFEYVDRFLRSVARGWTMLCGHPDPWRYAPPR